MNLFSLVGIFGIFGLVGAVVFVLRDRSAGPTAEAFDKARAAEVDGPFGSLTRMLITAARPLGSLPLVSERNSTIFQFVERKLNASGGAFGGQPEVFLAVQSFTALSGFVLLTLVVSGVWQSVSGFSGLMGTASGLLVAASIAILPYSSVNRRVQTRVAAINQDLPEFAELLQMPLTAGLSIMASLEFTARNQIGVVSEEAQNILLLTRTRSVSDAEAFELAGRRLGTPEAVAFFAALRQAHVEGARVVDVIGRQAKALREAQYQRQRAALKRVPVKLIVYFGIFLLPPVLVLIGFNFVTALSKF